MRKGIFSVLSVLAGAMIGAGAMNKAAGQAVSKAQTMSDKHLTLFLMMNRWLQVKQEGKSLADYFESHNYKSIAIYGMSYSGERLLDEMKDSGITVKYGIDKDAQGIDADICVLSPDETLEDVDAIIVTPIFFIDEIEDSLSKKMSCPVISLLDVLFEL